jgi:hypothetical protein
MIQIIGKAGELRAGGLLGIFASRCTQKSNQKGSKRD